MSGKFMKVKRLAIPTLTAVLIASQLCGCAATKESELLQMINNQQTICIEIAIQDNDAEVQEKEFNWTELAYKDSYPEFRLNFEDALNITAFGEGGKNGTIYVDLEGNHTNNSTLYYALMNEKFRDQMDDTDTNRELLELAKSTYTDIGSDAEAKLALYNAYFELINDAEPNSFNGSNSLTRAEFIGALYKSQNPVKELETDMEFQAVVDKNGENDNTAFAYELLDEMYLGLEDKSLTEDNFNGNITRAEAIYTLVQHFYKDKYDATTGKEKCFTDAKNGGNIALKQKFIEEHKNKETKEVTTEYKDYWMAYELQYALENPDKGMPESLYRAMVVAKQVGLINASECRWDESITKAETINFITRIYENMGTITNADRGKAVTESEVVQNGETQVENTDEMQDIKDGIAEDQAKYEELAQEGIDKLTLVGNVTKIDKGYDIKAEWIQAVNEYNEFYKDAKEEELKYVLDIIIPTFGEDADGAEVKQGLDLFMSVYPGNENLASIIEGQKPNNNPQQKPNNNGGGTTQQKPQEQKPQEQTPPPAQESSGGAVGSMDHVFSDPSTTIDLSGTTSNWKDADHSGIKLN